MTRIITITIKESNDERPKIVKHMDGSYTNVSEYARFFNSSSPAWTTSPEHNRKFLCQQQRFANEKLRAQGHLFLNEVYDMLGMSRSKIGAVVGWVYDRNNPYRNNRVDFGIFGDYNQDFVNNIEASALLEFNVDGCVIDKLTY